MKDCLLTKRLSFFKSKTITSLLFFTLFAVQASAQDALYVFGRGSEGALGTGNGVNQLSPVQIGTDEWQHISGGANYSLGIKADGTLWAWGLGGSGQLGTGNTSAQYSPVQIGTDEWQYINAGVSHSLGIKADGTLWAWGLGGSGQLGTGNPSTQHSPVQIGINWQHVSAGGSHSLGIRADGTLWAWGSGFDGQLGTGNTSTQYSPVQIGIHNWQHVSAGGSHSLGIKADGTLWAWGFGNNGRLGTGNTSNQLTPVQIGTDTDWHYISAGGHHSLGIKADGTLWAWGPGSYGELGTGNTSSQLTPIQIGTDEWQHISAGGSYSLGIKTDGTLWAWGSGSYGELGTGNTSTQYSPVQIGTAPSYSMVTAGGAHSLVLGDFICYALNDLILTNVTTNSSDLSWTPGGTETEWEIAYGAPGFDPNTQGTTETVNNDPEHTLSGLSLETNYEVYVRAVCGVDDYSDWVPLTFTTLSDLICTGDNWTAHPAVAAAWQSITYGNGKFVAVASSGTNRIMTSPDGENWTAHPAAENNQWNSVTYGNGKFVAVASNGTNRVMTSPDGVNWTAHPAAENNQWNSVTYGNGKFVAVSHTGTNRVMTSTDGENWTAHSAPGNYSWISVTYGNRKFVAVATNHRVMTSTDGISWTSHSPAEYNSWRSVTHGNGKFVAVATNGTNQVMTSADGKNWTAHPAAENNFWYSVTYGNGKFVTVGGNGVAMSSTDGENWTAHPAAENINWNSVIYGNGKFVAVGGFGSNVMVSTCTLPCNEPIDLAFHNITSNSVDLSWTPGDTETEWEVAYGTPGFDPDTQGSTETVNDTPEITLEDLDPNTQYEVYVKAVCDEFSESEWVGIDFTTINCPSQTFWDGISWSNNPPDSDSKMVIEGDLNITTAIEVCDIEINSGTLTVQSGVSITVNGVIVNNTSAENFVVSENAHIIQTSNEPNIGEITVLRNSTPMYQLDATFWSSPVSGQNLKDFSPGTLNGRFWIFDAFADAYVGAQPLTNDFAPGVGYVIQAPNDYPASDSGDSPLVFEGVFKGVPHNGNYSIATAAGNYNLIGNPYPSAIEAQSLINAHGTDIGTFYFWTHQSHPDPVEETYPYSNYATWTTMGGTAAEADDYTGDDPAPVPNGIIPPGQGFYIYTEGTEVTFTNAMRTTDEGHFYFYEPERHRYWLNLYSEQQAHNQILVGYMEGATNSFDYQIDGEMMNYNGNAIYTFLNEPNGQTPEGQIKKLVIQGRSLPFNDADVVPLGFNAVHSGQFVISLSQGDGIFAQGGQQVYLRDSRLNTITNISESPYSFYSASGEYNDRFELVYQTEGDLGVGSEEFANIVIYGHDYQVHITSPEVLIDQVVFYDILGRQLLDTGEVQSHTVSLPTEVYGNQILFVKVRLTNGNTHTKRIINR